MLYRKSMAISWLVGLIALTVAPLRAHDGLPATPATLWQHWNVNLPVLLLLGISLYVYWRGLTLLWQRRGAGRVVTVPQVFALLAGFLALFTALISPLDSLAEALFSAHMVQHLLLWLLAPPLLVFSKPMVPLLWGMPLGIRLQLGRLQHQPFLRSLWRLFRQPLVVWALHTAVLWLWHTPYLYELALRHDGLHVFEHICFVGVSLLYWWSLVYPIGSRQAAYGISIFSLFATAVQGNILGLALSFSQQAWYPFYKETVSSWGLSLLQDQQLAGAIMWLPSGLVYLLASLYVLVQWLAAAEV